MKLNNIKYDSIRSLFFNTNDNARGYRTYSITVKEDDKVFSLNAHVSNINGINSGCNQAFRRISKNGLILPLCGYSKGITRSDRSALIKIAKDLGFVVRKSYGRTLVYNTDVKPGVRKDVQFIYVLIRYALTKSGTTVEYWKKIKEYLKPEYNLHALDAIFLGHIMNPVYAENKSPKWHDYTMGFGSFRFSSYCIRLPYKKFLEVYRSNRSTNCYLAFTTSIHKYGQVSLKTYDKYSIREAVINNNWKKVLKLTNSGFEEKSSSKNSEYAGKSR